MFKIGDFAKLNKVTVKTLRHYDSLGLLQPENVDTFTGYRYEPTSGLDPTNSRIMKNIILKEKEKGKTIILTTHNMQDATELCDRVAFIVNGKVKALDSPHNLIIKKGAGLIHYCYIENGKEITSVCQLDKTSQDKMLCKLIAEGRLLTIHSSEPNLGDIFMEITGRQLI